MKKIYEMTGEELGALLMDTFGNDQCNLEDDGYVEDVLSDNYPRADIRAISPEAWKKAWNVFLVETPLVYRQPCK